MFKKRIDKNFLIFAGFLLLVCLIASIYYFKRIYQPWGTSWTDFTVFHRAGGRIIKGEEIYESPDTGGHGIDIYKYSPAFAYFMAPFTKMHMHKSVPLWYFLIFLSILASIYFTKEIIIRGSDEKSLPKCVYFLSFLMVLRFFFSLMSRVQSDSLVLFFISLSIYLLHRRKDTLSGFALGTAIMIKLTPLIFIPYFIYRKFYKMAASSIAAVLFYLCVPAIGLGWGRNIDFIRSWANALSVSTPGLMLWYKNQSLLSAVSRLFSDGSKIKIAALSPLLIKGIFLFLSAALIFIILYFCKGVIAKEEKYFGYGHLLEFSAILICMVIFSPIAWKHTFLHLIPACMVLIYYIVKYPKDYSVKYLLAAFFILASVLNPEILRPYNEIVSLYSNVTWGAVILIAALLRAASQLKKNYHGA